MTRGKWDSRQKRSGRQPDRKWRRHETQHDGSSPRQASRSERRCEKKVGQVTGNPDLTDEGQAEQMAGNVQKKVGQVEKVFGK
jgi:hypothetical protein